MRASEITTRRLQKMAENTTMPSYEGGLHDFDTTLESYDSQSEALEAARDSLGSLNDNVVDYIVSHFRGQREEANSGGGGNAENKIQQANSGGGGNAENKIQQAGSGIGNYLRDNPQQAAAVGGGAGLGGILGYSASGDDSKAKGTAIGAGLGGGAGYLGNYLAENPQLLQRAAATLRSWLGQEEGEGEDEKTPSTIGPPQTITL